MILAGTPEEIRALVAPSAEKKPAPILLRAQESGPCVYYDPHLIEHCTYPYDRACPHLDNPEILCPVKDACAAMQAIALLREACEAEQEEQDQDMAAEVADQVPRSDYVLAPRDPQTPGGDAGVPEFPALEPDEAAPYKVTPYKVVAKKGRAPGHVQEWTAEEDAALLGAANRHEALALYHERVPDSERSDAAIQRRWYDIREPRERAREARRDEWSAEEDAALIQAGAVTDVVDLFREAFPESTRSDKAITSRFYRARTRADRLHEAAPTPAPVEDAPPVTREKRGLAASLSAPITPGDRVALVTDPGRVGEVILVRNGHASVEFPGNGPARILALGDLQRVKS